MGMGLTAVAGAVVAAGSIEAELVVELGVGLNGDVVGDVEAQWAYMGMGPDLTAGFDSAAAGIAVGAGC